MAFATFRKAKNHKGTHYGPGGRYEIHSAATAAELHALARNGDESIRCFQDSAPAWARKIVSDITYYYNVAPHIKMLVSVNARLPFHIAVGILPRLGEVNSQIMSASHCDWLISDGTENLERFVQLFGRPEDRTVLDGPPQNYYLEFGYRPEAFEVAQLITHEVIERAVINLCNYLVSFDRLVDPIRN